MDLPAQVGGAISQRVPERVRWIEEAEVALEAAEERRRITVEGQLVIMVSIQANRGRVGCVVPWLTEGGQTWWQAGVVVACCGSSGELFNLAGT